VNSKPIARRLALLGCAYLLLLALGSGCGYQVVGYGAGDQDAIRVSIQTLANDTLEPGLELVVSEAMRRRFLRAGRIRLVEDPAGADYRLAGRVVDVRSVGRSFSENVRALEYNVSLRLVLDLEAADGEVPRLDPFGLVESEIYLASAEIEISRKNRDEALRRLAKLLADRVYDEVQVITHRVADQRPSGGLTRE
jgi:hypothetical protein